MGVCSSKEEKKQITSKLAETFAKTRYYQQKYMNEVFVAEIHNDLKIINVKTSQSIEGLQNNSMRRKGVSINRLALSGIRNGGIPILNINKINYKDSFRQKYHKVIGLLMSNTDLSIMENNQTQQLVVCQHTKDQEYIKWLKQKNFENDSIITIQEVQFFDSEYYIIFEYWIEEKLSGVIENKAIIIYQMIDAISYLHDNDLRHSSLTANSFKLINKFDSIKLVEIDQIYKQRDLNFEVYQYTSPEALSAPNSRTKPRDVWALGVIILELLLGHYPFLQKSNQFNMRRLLAVLKGLTQSRIEEIVSIFEKDVQCLLLGMLKINSNERWSISQCKINKWLVESLNHYSTHLQFPLQNFEKNKNLSQGRCVARYYLLRELDCSQFNQLYKLYQRINIEQSNVITVTQIRNYYSSIFLPENIKYDIIEFLYSLDKNQEFDCSHFIGLTSNLSKEKVVSYDNFYVDKQINIKNYLNQLKIKKKDLQIIKSDFSIEELQQQLSIDFFIKYLI